MQQPPPVEKISLKSYSYAMSAKSQANPSTAAPSPGTTREQGGAWSAAGRGALALLLVLAGTLPAACTKSGERPPSIVLIVIDTLRADRLGFLGHPRPTSPTMDAASRDWVVFEQAFSPAPFTMPSVASMMTGQYPDRTGVVNHASECALGNAAAPTLAELARKAGYRTGAVVSNPWLMNESMGFDRGFDAFLGKRTRAEGRAKRDAEAVTDDALSLLDAFGEDPFFLWTHYIDPHMPYEPPKDDAQALGLRRPSSAVVRDFNLPDRDKQIIYFEPPHPEDELEKTRLLYEAEIRRVDRSVGRLLAGLEARGRDQDTIVILASDHGESMGEHGLFFAHDFTLYKELLHVLLAVRVPGIQGRHETMPVSLVDIVPSLCGLLDWDCSHTVDGAALPLEGSAHASRTLFAASAPYRQRYSLWKRLEVRGLDGRWRAARHGDLKLIKIPTRDGALWEAYDLATDPGEENNLWPDKRFASLRAELEQWQLSMDAVHGSAGQGFEIDPATRRDLEALGYLDD
jgi:arylsulfatase A-like enzyme